MSESNYPEKHDAIKGNPPYDWRAIREYGPGKFQTFVDAYLYSWSLDGTDDQVGESDSTGWYGLLQGPFAYKFDESDYLPELNSDEVAYIEHLAGVILFENSQGFVYVTAYESDSELESSWAKVSAEIEALYDQDDESEDEAAQ